MTAMTVDALFDVRDRVAVVTGASSGLGARFAHVLHERGARVVIAARRADRLASLAGELGTEHVHAVAADVSAEAGVATVIAAAVERFGRLDIMINNAGIADGGAAESQDLESFERVLDLDLIAVFTGCRDAARVMLEQGRGSIINVASIAGLGSLAERHRMAAYAAAKAGVVGLTRELAVQWATRGVRVNAIAPGWFPTEMTGDLQDPDHVRWIESRTPMHRAGRIDELDGALVFLASDASSYVTGQVLVVDGGWTSW